MKILLQETFRTRSRKSVIVSAPAPAPQHCPYYSYKCWASWLLLFCFQTNLTKFSTCSDRIRFQPDLTWFNVAEPLTRNTYIDLFLPDNYLIFTQINIISFDWHTYKYICDVDKSDNLDMTVQEEFRWTSNSVRLLYLLLYQLHAYSARFR